MVPVRRARSSGAGVNDPGRDERRHTREDLLDAWLASERARGSHPEHRRLPLPAREGDEDPEQAILLVRTPYQSVPDKVYVYG
jgi:hypothetical protein